VSSSRHLRTLAGHGGTPLELAFSPDGKRLASSSTDQTVKIWDVATGVELQSLIGHTHWVRDVAFSPDGAYIASGGYDHTARIWDAPFSPASRSGEGSIAHLSAVREAAALVRHLAPTTSSHEELMVAIGGEYSINDAVRAAATNLAGEFLFHWAPLLDGHSAAERGDWSAAIDAFERVTRLAPGDPQHFHWLAMASLAADRHETYERACDALLSQCEANPTADNICWSVGTWLVSSHDERKLARLDPLVAAYARNFPDSPSFPCLYELRLGRTPRQFLASATPPANFEFNPESWYTLAMVQYKVGNVSEARTAYEAGMRVSAMGHRPLWNRAVCYERLRREVEALLATAPAAGIAPRPRVTTVFASPSESQSTGKSRESTPSAPK
jgi:hypothetical protein